MSLSGEGTLIWSSVPQITMRGTPAAATCSAVSNRPGHQKYAPDDYILSRHPTEVELKAVEEYAQSPGVDPRQAVNDLAWALINTKEFLYRH